MCPPPPPLGSRYQMVKQSLHTAVPERLVSRDAERAAIRSFLEERALGSTPASLYISGAPGTGKTACFHRVLADMKVLNPTHPNLTAEANAHKPLELNLT